MVLLVFLSAENIGRQSLSSTRAVIRKLRAFFVISATNSNTDAKRRSLILILFSWGQGLNQWRKIYIKWLAQFFGSRRHFASNCVATH